MNQKRELKPRKMNKSIKWERITNKIIDADKQLFH